MKTRQKFILISTLFLAVIIAANIDVSIRYGVNGKYSYIHMPLYVKWTQFLARHYEYARLAKEITKTCRTEEDRAFAVLKWTKDNIKDLPAGMPIVDEHILTIIIKGYGTPDQFQDVFATLCSYAGMPAFWDIFYDKEHRAKYAISFVKIGGRWSAFDAYRGIYFIKKDGRLASAEDIMKDPSLVEGYPGIEKISVGNIPYKNFYYHISLKKVENGETLRPYRQMPLRRIGYEIRKLFGTEKEEDTGCVR